jgi:hypothetical protein
MHLNEAKMEAFALIEAGNAVLLQSGSGLGKSSVAYQMFMELRDRDAPKGIKWGFGTIFAATQTPPDLIGYQYKGEREFVIGKRPKLDATGAPVVDGQGNVVLEDNVKKITVTDPSIPLWMISTEGKPAFMYDRFFLLIDEYGQGEGDVKRAVAEIFLNGGTAPWYLPPGSVRIACTNQGARYGVSKDFDFCIARRCLINIEGDIETTLRYMDKPYDHQGRTWQTTPVVKAWAAANPQIVFEAEPKEQGPWCNPRQLCAVDRYLQVKWEQQGNQDIGPNMIASIAGLIGMPAATSLLAHLEFLTQLPSYADVVADPANTPVPTRADLQMLMAYQMAGYTQVKDLGPCIQYVQKLPKDMGVTYIAALLRRDYKGIINQPAMQAWINKNAALVSIIASLAN